MIYPVSGAIPISKKNNDEVYGSLKMFVWLMCFCVCFCVGIIVLISQVIEKDINDNSYSN